MRYMIDNYRQKVYRWQNLDALFEQVVNIKKQVIKNIEYKILVAKSFL